MRTIGAILLAAVILCPLTANAMDVWGDQWGIWTKEGSPYNVVGEIRVPPESTLVIEPGIVVNFQGHYKFIVDSLATFLAVGTEEDSIFFTCDTLANPDRWHGIRFLSASSNSNLSYCRLEYGKATGSRPDNFGGAIYCYVCSPTISNNTISSNWADYGGGICCWSYSHPAISSNTISGNSAGDEGGGVYCGAGARPTIEFNIISGNAAIGGYERGGGIFCWGCSPEINNNTITRNSASEGGGINCYSSNPTITNTILWGDTAANGPEIYLRNSHPSVTYCDIPGGWTGQGNINADPLFANPEAGDFRLQLDSPCIDTGDPNSPPDPDGTRADMGAFYFDQRIFTPREFDFPLLIGEHTERLLYLQNVYGDTVWFSLSSGADWISFSPDSGQIVPDSTVNVLIVFDGTYLPIGPNYSTILLDILGPFQDQYEIPVVARVFSTDYTYISLTPDTLPITIPPEGGTFSFWAQTFNATDFTYFFDLWIDAALPAGGTYGPIKKQRNFRFKPQYGAAYHLIQDVPGYAPPGEYSYNFKMGVLPDQVDFQDSFTFTKLETGSSLGRVSVTSWDLVGWGEEFSSHPGGSRADAGLTPTDHSLSQNYPNPFNASTVIEYQLPQASEVRVEVYNLIGQKVATLADERQQAGYRSVVWDASEVSSGLYFYRLTAGDYTETKRMMLVK